MSRIKFLLTTTAAAVLVSSAALAADLPSRRAPPVYVPPPLPVFSWTGFYVGGQVGYEFGKSTGFSTFLPTGAGLDAYSSNRNGIIGGGHVGYLLSTQSFPVIGSFFGPGGLGTGGVIGLEGDVDGTSARANAFLPVTNVVVSSRNGIQGSIRGRLGVAFDRVLFYATGGAAFGGFNTNYFNPTTAALDTVSRTRVGYTVGGGIEYAFTNNLSLRAEYRYSDFGKVTDILVNTTASTAAVTRRATDNRVQAGFSYKFDTPIAPVVARY